MRMRRKLVTLIAVTTAALIAVIGAAGPGQAREPAPAATAAATPEPGWSAGLLQEPGWS
ncbi:hypothetical protein [Streptomyces sp. NPDC007369]|uniref:hypothetical protein n=1 Tax=Streptomyces sp. NPDC007369 TaxID=3154589 RepID=UPI0033EA5C94